MTGDDKDFGVSEHPAMGAIEEMLHQINGAVQEIEDAEQKVRNLSAEFQRRVVALAKLGDKNERLRIVRHLYWNEPRATVKALSAALLIDWDHATDQPKYGPVDLEKFVRYGDQLRRMVGPVMVPCSSPGCDEPAPVRSRTERDSKFSRTLCETCAHRKEMENQKRWAEHEAQWQEHKRQREINEASWHKELAELRAGTALAEDELMRLYELMSYFDRDRRS